MPQANGRAMRNHLRSLAITWAMICVCALSVMAPSTQVLLAQGAIAPKVSSSPPIYFGVFYPDAPNSNNLRTVEQTIGKGVSLVLWYQDWKTFGVLQEFPVDAMEAIRQHGSIPVLAWQPAAYNNASAADFALAKIATGAWDSYLRKYAKAAAAWGHPFFLRFASEMNGSWTTWSEQNNGNHPGDFVKAWRHVHDIFVSEGATNATWVWCPNVVNSYTIPLKELYPGDQYVNWVAMDGYNYGPTLGGVPWRSFATIFGETYNQLVSLAPSKPFMVGEMGTVEDGGSKADWIRDALVTQIPSQFPRIRAIIWFDAADGNLDLRVDTTRASLSAFHQAISSSLYKANMYRDLIQRPIPSPSFAVPVPPSAGLIRASAPILSLSGPPAGTIEVLDSRNGHPISNSTLVYQNGAWTITDVKGRSLVPTTKGLTIRLDACMVDSNVINIGLNLNPKVGYQVMIDTSSWRVNRIIAHVRSLPPQQPALPSQPPTFALNVTPLTIQIGLLLLNILFLLGLIVRKQLERRRMV